MNPGPLLFVYLALLAYLVVRKKASLITVWVLAYVAFPTIRSRFGPVSLYWGDIAALAVFARFISWRGAAPGLKAQRRWIVLLMGTLSVGALTTLMRYGAVLEPGYWMYRFALALLPLTVVPRALAKPELFEAFARGVYASGVIVGVVAIGQSLGGAPTELLYQLFYGGYGVTERPTSIRVYGMYHTSTAFAGAGVLLALLSLLLIALGQRGRLAYASVGLSLVATLLTYSRHGLLALLVAFAAMVALNPRRFLKTIGFATLALLLASAIVNVGYWNERLSRGGITDDPNLRARLVQRPLEFIDRLTSDPTFALVGVGLGLEHLLDDRTYREATYGFVSNTLLLYMVFAGILAFLAFLALFLSTLWRAIHVQRPLRAIAVAAVLGVLVILVSDNYGFYKPSVWFLWASVVALVRPMKRVASSWRAPTSSVPRNPVRGQNEAGPIRAGDER